MAIKNTSLSHEELHALFTQAEKIFFIGIGGISMSATAEFCAILGKEVFGCDNKRTKLTERLEKTAKIKYSSTPDNVKGMDMVVYTNAIDERNYEYREARRKKIPVVSRANLLGYLISLHKTCIGVSGAHGKSTTTSMLGHIFYCADENPTVFCGAEMINFSSNFRFGGRTYCIFEACEYQNSFLHLPATDAVVLNIDYDHPDFFGCLDEMKNSFRSYVRNAKRVFLSCDNEHTRELTHTNIITFGFNAQAAYRAEICKDEEATKNDAGSKALTRFNVYRHGKFLCCCSIPFFGKHMVTDSLCAFAVAHTNGISPEKICHALATFKGTKRRMCHLKKTDTGADVFEDYAHHPTEIESSLSSLSEMGYKRILCVFQPHTFSRTHFLYSRFTSAFKAACELIIVPTFCAREENIFELSEDNFARDCGGEFISDFEKIRHRVAKTDCDCVVLMGAGDLTDKLRI